MNPAVLKEVLRRTPLTIRLVSGRSIHLADRRRMLVSDSGAMLAVLLENGAISTIGSDNIESVTPDKSQQERA